MHQLMGNPAVMAKFAVDPWLCAPGFRPGLPLSDNSYQLCP